MKKELEFLYEGNCNENPFVFETPELQEQMDSVCTCRPLMGVWIEIIIFSIPLCDVTPLWGCGFYSKNSRSDDTGRLFLCYNIPVF